MPEEKLPTFGVQFYAYMQDGEWFKVLEPLNRLKVVTVRNMATHAGRSVSAGELNRLCEVLFEGRALEVFQSSVGKKKAFSVFSAFACVSAKTQCAICAVGFFSMAYNVQLCDFITQFVLF